MVFLCRHDLKPDLETVAKWAGDTVIKLYLQV